MQDFVNLFSSLDSTTKTLEKIGYIEEYLQKSSPLDSIYAISFLTGRKPKGLVNRRKLREWVAKEANVPDWLFDESYYTVGDLGETIALLLPEGKGDLQGSLQEWIENNIYTLKGAEEEDQKELILSSMAQMTKVQRFVYVKLITSSFRVGVSQSLVIKAIAKYAGIEESVVAHRMMGEWPLTEDFYNTLVSTEELGYDSSRPYPFYLAYQLDIGLDELGSPHEWQVEWKYDGIRCQIIKRKGEVFIWSRGEEMINETFPEIAEAALLLPDGTVLDAELMAWKDGLPMRFSDLQRRIGRKKPSKKIMSEVPIAAICFDILEYGDRDIRQEQLIDRRQSLNTVIEDLEDEAIITSEPIVANTWEEYAEIRKNSRDRLVEGFMLKRTDSPYRNGRRKGDWWKWKIDPLTADAVMIYAQRGSGRRATLYSDYTFAVWNDGKLIPFAKAYSGLTDKEMAKIDKWIKSNTLERFGPVRSVKPEIVFEVAFEGIQRSTRHKSGIAVRFPRIHRVRDDKKPEEADTLDSLLSLIESHEKAYEKMRGAKG
ncbi:MAG: ATP-dependent DNA ligase [Candidatus Kapaibacteriales bacterium]